MEDEAELREKIFHNLIREYVIFLLLFILLYVSSYCLISSYKKKREEFYIGDDEDAVVYRISLWMCNFSLAVSVGAALLLPISIISNEVLLLYPNSYYVQWLNSSLIQGLWNHVFLFSNLSLFVLLPFAYFFTESEGLPGSRKGIMARVYETFLVLVLLGFLILGMTYLLSAFLDYGHSSIESLFTANSWDVNIIKNVWNYYLPFLYSCVSFLGVLLLLVCTPVGFAHLFTVLGELVVKPQFLRNIQDEYYVAVFEEQHLKRKLQNAKSEKNSSVQNGVGHILEELQSREKKRKELEKQRKVSPIRRNLGYPFVMVLLLALTGISVVMVAHNTLELLVGIKALPIYTEQFSLGISSLSALGAIGASLEIVLILYLWLASVVGFYTLPLLCRLRPHLHDTSMTQVIGNCAVLLILSSALPVLARTLGITNFDLLGDFGRIEWLGNFYIVLFYNLVFAVATALCLVTKFTAAVRQELIRRFKSFAQWTVTRERRSLSMNGIWPHSKDD
ncbi:limb region 1 protein homolog isoform X1 [Centruroides sculpturatus]|uniref:limb region 1 protein homolog isoform X1 n=1 Tax=Centruroides sculpturatus TaxID=218467 RepID=UPI000C6CFF51|nr:limb region 1 protein homolog isoform X1 [Centruroides sculpturatus]